MAEDLRPLRADRYYTESEIAAHANALVRAWLDAGERGEPRRTRTQYAARLSGDGLGNVAPAALSMALRYDEGGTEADGKTRPARYTDRGHAIRRRIVAMESGVYLHQERPSFRADREPTPELTPPAPAG